MTIKEQVIHTAREEWDFFGNQERGFTIVQGKQVIKELKKGHPENESPYSLRVAKYWKDALNLPHSGTDDIAWSAAFISYLIKTAGVHNSQFLFSSQHSQYIREAIVSKVSADHRYGFWGYKLSDYAPAPGDLVCYVRGKAVGKINYDSNSNDYESHADLVVEKSGNILKVIGGNVGNSVTLKHLLLDDNGLLIDETEHWFVVLKNNLMDTKMLVVTGDGVRLRPNPVKDNVDPILSLFKGDQVAFHQLSDDQRWSQVTFKDKTGWVSNLFLKPLSPATGDPHINGILDIVAKSTIRNYKWLDRGVATLGYYEGMALMFARLYCRLKSGDKFAKEMAKAAGANDALTTYDEIFDQLGMDNDSEGPDTLRHLFTLMVGLGMRESSGRHCEGRDMAADNTTSDTAEAGLFQTSYNVRSVSPLLPEIFAAYKIQPDGFVDFFSKGITCKPASWADFGEGDGREFQRLSKACPGFAVEFTAVAMRNTARHWGPIINKKAEVRSECHTMFLAVQHFIDLNGISKL